MNKRATTKDKILHLLKKDFEMSIKQMMEYFTISEIAVRKHLADLIRDGFVRERTVKQEIGRPYHLYTLTKKGHEVFPNQYEQLPMELLKDLESINGPEAVDDLLIARKDREEEELSVQLEHADFDQKMKRMVAWLEDKGYMIELEKSNDGHYEMKNFNCPIYNLASNYQVICQHEKEMYENVFSESKVKVHACMTKGESYCKWLITKPEEHRVNEK